MMAIGGLNSFAGLYGPNIEQEPMSAGRQMAILLPSLNEDGS
jgi:hypothetical protein